MKTCWKNAIEGIMPNQEECDRLHPNGCDDCLYFLPDPPEPDGDGDLDEIPDFNLKQAVMVQSV